MSPFAPPKVAAAGQAIHYVRPLGVAKLKNFTNELFTARPGATLPRCVAESHG